MNERIKELYKEAYGARLAINDFVLDSNEKKFAEFIVRECMLVIEDAVDHREPASTYVAKLADHFGVTG